MIRILELLQNINIKNFCMRKKKQVRIIQQIYPHCYSVGKYKIQPITDIIRNAFDNSEITYDNFTIYQYFSRSISDFFTITNCTYLKCIIEFCKVNHL